MTLLATALGVMTFGATVLGATAPQATALGVTLILRVLLLQLTLLTRLAALGGLILLTTLPLWRAAFAH